MIVDNNVNNPFLGTLSWGELRIAMNGELDGCKEREMLLNDKSIPALSEFENMTTGLGLLYLNCQDI